MKIAIFTDVYLPEVNGVVTSIDTFSRLLIDRGHEVVIFCPKYPDYQDKVVSGLTVYRFSAFSFSSYQQIKVAFPSLIRVTSILRRFKPDIIHCQTPMSIGITGVIAAEILRIKNVQTYHTYMPDMITYLDPKKIFGLDKLAEGINGSKFLEFLVHTRINMPINGQRLITESDESVGEFLSSLHFGKKKRTIDFGKRPINIKLMWQYTRLVYNRADLVLTPSAVLGRILKRHQIKPPVKTQTNGINLVEFKVKKDYKSSHKILHYGRLGFEKEIDVVVRAFALAADKDEKLKLHIVGDGPARKSLEKLSSDLGVAGRVVFEGFVDRDVLKQKIYEYDLFLTASPMETQGLVILEAMACGLPVVGAKVLAVPEAIKNNVNGYLVKRGDFEAMARRIERLESDQGLRKRMGAESLRLVARHEISQAVETLIANYQSVIEGKL